MRVRARPVTWGAAIEVPLMVFEPLLPAWIQALVMLLPGAKTSTPVLFSLAQGYIKRNEERAEGMSHTPSPVGEAGLDIGGIDRPDGVGERLSGWRKMACILVVVTSGDNHAQTRADSSSNGVVERLRVGTPQGHIRNLSANVSATHTSLHVKGRGLQISEAGRDSWRRSQPTECPE